MLNVCHIQHNLQPELQKENLDWLCETWNFWIGPNILFLDA